MANLDKSQISTGVLYDRVAGMAALDVFNLCYNNPDTSSVSHFLQAYYEMHVTPYVTSSQEPSRQVLRDNARYYAERGQVLIGALRYRFNYIDSNAVANNQLRWSAGVGSLLYDVAGRNGSPYLLREVVVGSALADTLRQGSVNFRLDPGSIFTNVGAALSSASIDFGDGNGVRGCSPGQNVSVSYPSAGAKVLRYTFNYADGSQFTTYSSIYVQRGGCINCRPLASGSEPCRTIPLINTRAYNGLAGQEDISYYYSTTRPCDGSPVNVTKPVIIIDGFDHNDTRKATDIFGTYLYYRDANGASQNLGDELRQAGYDVVIMNEPNVYEPVTLGPFTYQRIKVHGGSDYMERNGLALVTLIAELNRQMQAAGSTEEIVVIGPSMGGQIARYALSYMEANGPAHNTRLYLSLDSPHNGANIPIGLQHFVKYFADQTQDSQLVDGLEQIDSPASRELASAYYTQNSLFQAHPERSAFMNAVLSFSPDGLPANLRRIAITNGALNGNRQKDQNGRIINDLDQAFFFEQRGVPQGGFTGFIVRALFPIGLIGRLITTASGRVWYAPGQGQLDVVARTYKITDRQNYFYATGPSASCGLDGAPGGYRNFFSELAAGQNSGGVFQKRTFYSVRDKAVFIPMLSALAFKNSTSYNNCMAVDGTNLVCNGMTPFDAYYGPTGVNEPHIQLTPGNVEFIRNEVFRKVPTPVFTLAPNTICPDGLTTAQFSVAIECNRAGQPGTTYNWTAGNGLQIVNGQGTSSVSVQGTTGFLGTTTLQVVAIRAGYTASAPATATILVSNSYVDTQLDLQGAQKVCPYTTVIVRVTGVNVQPPYYWTETHYRNGVPGFTGSFTTQVPEYAVSMDTEPVDLTVTAASTCTGATVAEAPRTITPYVDPNGGFYCDPATLRVAPNPADTYVEISTRPDNAPPAPPQAGHANPHAFQAQLHDGNGRVVGTATTQDGLTRLTTAGLPAGLYHLVIQRGRNIARRNLSVQH